jgi:hypothetical protein
VVSFSLMLRTLLLTSYCVGSFQRPVVPRAEWLLDARRGEDVLQTINIRLFYMLSAHVYFVFCETTYLSEHKPSPECHIIHIFVPEELYFSVSSTIPYIGMQQATDQNIHNVHSRILRRIPRCDPLSP